MSNFKEIVYCSVKNLINNLLFLINEFNIYLI